MPVHRPAGHEVRRFARIPNIGDYHPRLQFLGKVILVQHHKPF
jgi:hypothetical protein